VRKELQISDLRFQIADFRSQIADWDFRLRAEKLLREFKQTEIRNYPQSAI